MTEHQFIVLFNYHREAKVESLMDFWRIAPHQSVYSEKDAFTLLLIKRSFSLEDALAVVPVRPCDNARLF